MTLNRIFKASIITISLSLCGCSSMVSMWNGVEKSYADAKFEDKVKHSKLLIHEANMLMAENDYDGAKSKLDEAYVVYSRQASLHDSYRNYYEVLGDERLSRLANLRFEKMVQTSDILNEKGRYAMVQLNHIDIAADLFNLSLIYHDKNTSALINIATLAYSTHDSALAHASLKMLNAIGHRSPEASMLEYLVADREGDMVRKMLVKLIMKNSWPDSVQYHFIDTGVIKGDLYGA